jgi:hypothetical protein
MVMPLPTTNRHHDSKKRGARMYSSKSRTVLFSSLRLALTWVSLMIASHFLCPSCGASECITSVDCAMNGECTKLDDSDAQAPGKCNCFDGWKGDHCETLDLMPVDPQRAGLKLPNHDSSTWGGSVVYRDGLYHMFASEIINDCGLYAWTTNSQVIRAVSKSPFGPYQKVEVILPVFAHDANIVEAPTGELVLYVTAQKGIIPRDCRNGTFSGTTFVDTSASLMTRMRRRTAERNSTAPPKDTFMTWAPHPEGPWSEPVMVLDSTIWNSDYWAKNHRIARCDSCLNGIILKDDRTFLGLWRRCETEDLLTIPHLLVASDWRNASTYLPDADPLFVLGGSGAEDPSNIWTTTTKDGVSAYHAIFHDEQATRCMLGQCSANGRHAFSLDGKSWRYASEDAYQRGVLFTDGRYRTVDTRARPHLILDPQTRHPIALSTGVKESDKSGYVWTMVQPLRSETSR